MAGVPAGRYSRPKRYDLAGDNTAAVAGGLQRTGGIITSLALLVVIVVGAFSASGISCSDR